MNKDEIMAAKDLPTVTVEVEVPEWGEGAVVWVRTLTALEGEGLEGINKKPNYMGRFAAIVLCDKQGNRIFTDEDAGTLGEMPAPIMLRINDVAQKLNGMDKLSQEEAAKN